MQTPNKNGAYKAEFKEELARQGRCHATVEICQCDDGLFRYALDVMYSYGGFSDPISKTRKGFSTYKAAKDAATKKLLQRFPAPRPEHPHSVNEELRAMKTQIESALTQPSLF